MYHFNGVAGNAFGGIPISPNVAVALVWLTLRGISPIPDVDQGVDKLNFQPKLNHLIRQHFWAIMICSSWLSGKTHSESSRF